MRLKFKIIGIILIIVLLLGVFLYFRYFFTFEQKNIVKRKVETITGQNLTITVFSYEGKIIKRWTNVKKITSKRENGNLTYSYFYTKDGNYVQIPNSVWYIAEEIDYGKKKNDARQKEEEEEKQTDIEKPSKE